MILSRRFFLFGSAAAVASAAVSLPGVDRSSILLAPSARSIPFRSMHRLLFMANKEGGPALTVEVTRVGPGSTGLPILSMSISPYGSFEWSAPPGAGAEIYLPEGHALNVSVTPDPGTYARMEVDYRDRDGAHFSEIFRWRDGVAVVTDQYRMVAL